MVSNLVDFQELDTPEDIRLAVAGRFRKLRKNAGFKSRQKLAMASGVPAPTIAKFERTGEISLRSLIGLSFVVEAHDHWRNLFVDEAPKTLEDLRKRFPK